MIQLKTEKPMDNLEMAKTEILHKIDSPAKIKKRAPTIIAVILIILAGLLSGYLLSISQKGLITSDKGTSQTSGGGDKKITVGSSDTKTFKDSAEGTLEVNDKNGEGTHRLIRPGGDSQTVYLTSSVLDLNQFVGKKVRVWGETFAAKKVGWLMDVGKIEVL